RGVPLSVHHAIADSVNDQNGYRFWMRQAVLARKARTSRASVNAAVAKMLELGLLELVNERPGGANEYRLLMLTDAPVVYDTRANVTKATSRRRQTTEPAAIPGLEGVKRD